MQVQQPEKMHVGMVCSESENELKDFVLQSKKFDMRVLKKGNEIVNRCIASLYNEDTNAALNIGKDG